MIQRARSYLLDLIFPPRCVGCQRNGQLFCDACAQAVQVAPSQRACSLCGCPLSAETALRGAPCADCRTPLGLTRAAAVHAEPLQAAIHALKYEGRGELAASLARYLRAAAMESPWPAILGRLDGIVPVPLHKDRLRERGYNQAEMLADSFARGLPVPVLAEAVARVHATRSQVGLSARERAENVLGKFRGAPELARGNSLLLVDDVVTTGATLGECAAALRAAGAAAVYGLALAKPVSDRELAGQNNGTPAGIAKRAAALTVKVDSENRQSSHWRSSVKEGEKT